MTTPERVLEFWLDECSPEDWYKSDPVFDQAIRDEFEPAWNRAMEGAYSLWLTYPSGTLAYIILTDQFSRNMFRDTGKAFASDALALAASKKAIEQCWDLRIDPPGRDFFYLPLRHSESGSDQDRSVRLVMTRMPGADKSLLHAKAHREVIRAYGRFPTRNAALGRTSTAKEQDYLDNGGYGRIVRDLDRETA